MITDLPFVVDEQPKLMMMESVEQFIMEEDIFFSCHFSAV